VAELEELKRRGVHLIADFDDLLFSRRATGLPSSALGRDGSRPDSYRSVLSWFDEFTASTEPLCERLSEVEPAAPVHFVPNGPSHAWIEQGRALYRRWQPEDPKVIRYFSGSPSHDADLASMARPLEAFLARHGDVNLELVGSFGADELPIAGPRVKRMPRVRYDALPKLLASTWLNLAPLSENDFNQCKSAIKLLEAGAFGCPTLASPNPDIERHRSAGAEVVICRAESDWAEELEGMLDDQRRQRIGQSLDEYVQKNSTANISGRAFSAVLGAA
jgi:glycosyltransferase involved in cell wall biosynthesis